MAGRGRRREQRVVGADGDCCRGVLGRGVRPFAGRGDRVKAEWPPEPALAADVPDDRRFRRSSRCRGCAPSRLNSGPRAEPEWPLKRSRRLAVGMSQTLTLPSSEVVASTLPSGLNASASTRPGARRSIGRCVPVRRSRSTTLPSSFPKAARPPDGETAAAPEIGNVRTGLRRARVEQERPRLAARDEERTPVVGEADEAAAGDHLRPPKLAAVGDPARDDHLVGRAAGAGDGLARERTCGRRA